MNIHEFLSQPQLQLPVVWTGSDFVDFTQTLLDNYCRDVRKISGVDDETQEVINQVMINLEQTERFCARAIESLKLFMSGKSFGAFKAFSDGINNVSEHINNQSYEFNDPMHRALFFRVRKGIEPDSDRDELFHVPFESRNRVSTQRYSKPGLPCLYLGGSIYTCWMEMGQPAFSELTAAAFWCPEECQANVLNFTIRPKLLVQLLRPCGKIVENVFNRDKVRAMIIDYFSIWPLLALCSIKVRDRAAFFKPEYLIPQSVLEWIIDSETYDGIAYFSTHVKAVVAKPQYATSNLVFPARKITSAGRCQKLREMFRMTMPINWQVLCNIQLENIPYGNDEMFSLSIIEGHEDLYFATDFGKVQTMLGKLAKDIKSKIELGDEQIGKVRP